MRVERDFVEPVNAHFIEEKILDFSLPAIKLIKNYIFFEKGIDKW